MKNWAIQNREYFIGALLGALAGLLYWKYMSCTTGTCAISSSPVNSALFFALMGIAFSGNFKKKKAQADLKDE